MNFDALTSAVVDTVPAGLVSLYLFGSRASGRAHRESDLDVAVLLDPDQHATAAARFDVRVMLGSRLAHVAGPGVPVDVVVLNDAPPHLARRIMTEGRRLRCVDADRDAAAKRTALSRAADLQPFLRRMRRLKLDALAR